MANEEINVELYVRAAPRFPSDSLVVRRGVIQERRLGTQLVGYLDRVQLQSRLLLVLLAWALGC